MTVAAPMLDGVPKQLHRALRALMSQESFRDTRSVGARLFGPAHFSWTTGWMIVDRVSHAFVHMSAPPHRLAEARDSLAAGFHVQRIETGVLDRRRSHPFMIVLISGVKEPV